MLLCWRPWVCIREVFRDHEGCQGVIGVFQHHILNQVREWPDILAKLKSWRYLWQGELGEGPELLGLSAFFHPANTECQVCFWTYPAQTRHQHWTFQNGTFHCEMPKLPIYKAFGLIGSIFLTAKVNIWEYLGLLCTFGNIVHIWEYWEHLGILCQLQTWS